MNAVEYQRLSARTLNKVTAEIDTQKLEALNYFLGIQGELYELRKCGVDSAEYIDELGDCWWYLAALHTVFGEHLDVSIEYAEQSHETEECATLGQLAEMLKKWVFHDKPLDKHKLAMWLGDLTVNLTKCLNPYQDVGAVWEHNIQKLQSRYPDGFVLGGGIR